MIADVKHDSLSEGYPLICRCSLSGNFLVKIPNRILFCISPICLFKAMLYCLIAWHLSSMKSVVDMFPVLYHCSLVLFSFLSLPDFWLCAALLCEWNKSNQAHCAHSVNTFYASSKGPLSVSFSVYPVLFSKYQNMIPVGILQFQILIYYLSIVIHTWSYVLPPSSSALSPTSSPGL